MCRCVRGQIHTDAQGGALMTSIGTGTAALDFGYGSLLTGNTGSNAFGYTGLAGGTGTAVGATTNLESRYAEIFTPQAARPAATTVNPAATYPSLAAAPANGGGTGSSYVPNTTVSIGADGSLNYGYGGLIGAGTNAAGGGAAAAPAAGGSPAPLAPAPGQVIGVDESKFKWTGMASSFWYVGMSAEEFAGTWSTTVEELARVGAKPGTEVAFRVTDGASREAAAIRAPGGQPVPAPAATGGGSTATQNAAPATQAPAASATQGSSAADLMAQLNSALATYKALGGNTAAL